MAGGQFFYLMDTSDLVVENSIKLGLFKDIFSFLKHFSLHETIKFKEFAEKWKEMDMSLLTLVSSFEQILSSLHQAGLFSPTRPFLDHQLLIFFFFAIFKLNPKREFIKVSLDRMKFILSIGTRAKLLNETETVEAFNYLCSRDAFIILADDPKSFSRIPATKYFHNQNRNQSQNSSLSIPSPEQLHDRITRIQNFLQANPLFDQKISRNSFNRLKGLFENYYENKKRNFGNENQGTDHLKIMEQVFKVVEGYERILPTNSPKSSSSSSYANANNSNPVRSVRARLSQSSSIISTPLNPIADDLFLLKTRPQSVPAPSRLRRLSSLKEKEGGLLEEFIENSNAAVTNMPSINFY